MLNFLKKIYLLGDKTIEISKTANDDEPLDTAEIKFEEHVNPFIKIKEEASQEENVMKNDFPDYENSINHNFEKDNEANGSLIDVQIVSYDIVNENLTELNPDQQPENDHKEKQTLNCDLCDYSTSNLRYIKQHKERRHSKGKYKCSICDFTEHRPHLIRIHMQKNHDIVNMKYMLDTKDPTIKYFPCPFKCNSNTQPKSEEELDLHILRRHYTSKFKKSGI